MPANKKLLILPGDGIGPEVMREVRRVIDWMDRRRMGALFTAAGDPYNITVTPPALIDQRANINH